MREIDTASDGENDFFDDSPAFDGESKTESSEGGATSQGNLTNYRWRQPILSAGAERDLLRAAQAGDERAKNRLAQSFHRLVLAIAKRFHGPSRDDLIAAGMVGLSEAINRYDLRRNTRLKCFAEWIIREAVRKEAKAWRRRGQAGETRADRWVYNHREALPHEVAAKVGGTIRDAQDALDRSESYWHGHDRYDTTERPIDRYGNTGPAASNVWQSNPFAYLWFPVTRIVGVDGVPSQRGRRIGLVEALAEAADRRAARRLTAIGRRAYALELVERERRLIARRSDPNNYLYPWCRWGYEPIELPAPKRPRKPKRQIRVWRAAPAWAIAA